jgi:hypothetical protein
MGNWTGDEYLMFRWSHGAHWSYWLERMSGWAPRPVSEALLALYGQAIDWMRLPLIAPFLAVTWALLLAGGLMARRGVLPVLLLLSAFLLVDRPGEAYFWPVAAAAYLPTLAGMLFVVLVAEEGWSGVAELSLGWRVALAVALLITAGSSELGIAAVLALGGLSLASWLLTGRPGRTEIWITLPAMLLGVGLAAVLLGGRGQFQEAMWPQSPYLHHPLASLLASLPLFVREVAGYSHDGQYPMHLTLGLPIKAALLLGFCAVTPRRRRSVRPADFVLPAALVLAAWSTSVFALLQFGVQCCERQQTMRQDFLVLAFYAFACLVPLPARWQRGGVGLLAAALLALSALRLPGLAHDLRAVRDAARAEQQTWADGLQPGETMTVWDVPGNKVVNPGVILPPGLIRLGIGPDPGLQQERLLHFFGKTSALVLPNSNKY